MSRHLSCGLAAAWIALGVLGPRAAAGDEVPAEIVAIRAETRASPRSADLWIQRLGFETQWAAAECARTSSSSEDCNDAWRPVFDGIFAEWQQLLPGEPLPRIYRLRFGPPAPSAEALFQALLELDRQYPQHPDVVAGLVRELSKTGRSAEAKERIERLVAARSTDAASHQVAFDFFARMDNKTQALEHLQAWLQLAPAAPEAIAAWFRLDPSAGDLSPVIETAIADLLAEPPETAATVEVCRELLARRRQASGQRCFERLAASAVPKVAAASRAALLAEAVQAADAGGIDRWSSDLPADERIESYFRGARQIAACADRVRFLRQRVIAEAVAVNRANGVASSLVDCSRNPEAQTLSLELLEQVPASQLEAVFHASSIRVVGRQPDYNAPVDKVVTVLERRWSAAPGDATLFRLLDQAYEDAGADAKRLEFLGSRLAADPQALDSDQYEALADLLLDLDRNAEAAEILAKAPFVQPQLEHLRGQILLDLGRQDEARALANVVVEDQDNATRRARGFELLAALDAARGDVAAALGGLEQAVATGQASEELQAFHTRQQVAQGEADTVVEGALAECARESRGETSTRLCAAQRLLDRGAMDAARPLLESMQEAPVADLEVLERAAGLSARSGWHDLALALSERLLRLDPASAKRWGAVAAARRRTGDIEALERLAREAERSQPEASFEVQWNLAKAYLDAQRTREAIDLLLSLRERSPHPEFLDDTLREAYRQLGEEP